MTDEFMKSVGGRLCRAMFWVLLVLLSRAGVNGALAEDSTQPPDGSSAISAPEITAISPSWGPSGWVLSLTLEGRNLLGASEVKFYPSTGIVVEDAPVVNSEGTLATVKVTILIHAPLGPRLVVIRTPAGQSSLTPTEANTFKVSFAHLH